MLPLYLELSRGASPNADPQQYVQERERWEHGTAEKFTPMAIMPDNLKLHIYESAFIEGVGVQATIRNPDETAADLLHELYHFRQENSGYGSEWRNKFGYKPNIQRILHELEAYYVTSTSMLYRVVYKDRLDEVIAAGVQPNVKEFRKHWDGNSLDGSEKKSLAEWAWSQPNGWMRVLMSAGAPVQGGVWASVCASKGANFCQNLSTRK